MESHKGAKVRTRDGEAIPDGARGLVHGVDADLAGLVAKPPGGVTILSDVSAPPLGPTGEATVFGPQKGAGPDEIAFIGAALSNWARMTGHDPSVPGAARLWLEEDGRRLADVHSRGTSLA
ncbi:glycerate kinase [Agromyces silvae]|uniref:glycerate kinase n=1 Tax=Agromyces silvae TaxID=3388266 RepID=UPI00280A7012|nr:glycerate kinase [Agromyces protaetiae]